jgi:hypothetical protein
VRIQNDLNALGLAMRDMLDGEQPYPLTAWSSQFERLRADLEDALAREEALAPVRRTSDQREYLRERGARCRSGPTAGSSPIWRGSHASATNSRSGSLPRARPRGQGPDAGLTLSTID